MNLVIPKTFANFGTLASDTEGFRDAAEVFASQAERAAGYKVHATKSDLNDDLADPETTLEVGDLVIVEQDESRTDNVRALYEIEAGPAATFIREQLTLDSDDELLPRHNTSIVQRFWTKRSVVDIMTANPSYSLWDAVEAAWTQAEIAIIEPNPDDEDGIWTVDRGHKVNLDARAYGLLIAPGATIKLQDTALWHDGSAANGQGATAMFDYTAASGQVRDASMISFLFENYGVIDGNQTNNRGFSNLANSQPGRDVHGISFTAVNDAIIHGGTIKDVWWATAVGGSESLGLMKRWTVKNVRAIDATASITDNEVRGSGLAVRAGAAYGFAQNIYANGYSESVDLNPVGIFNTFDGIFGENITETVLEFSGTVGTVARQIWGLNCRKVLAVTPYSTITGEFADLLNEIGTLGTGTKSPGTKIDGVYGVWDSNMALTTNTADSNENAVELFNLADECHVTTALAIVEDAPTESIDRLGATSSLASLQDLSVLMATDIEFAADHVIDFGGGRLEIRRMDFDIAEDQTFCKVTRFGRINFGQLDFRTGASGSQLVAFDVTTGFNRGFYYHIDEVSGIESELVDDASVDGWSADFRINPLFPADDAAFRPYDVGDSIWLSSSVAHIEESEAGSGDMTWKSIGGLVGQFGDPVVFEQSTAGSKPTLTNGILIFDGTDDYLENRDSVTPFAEVVFTLCFKVRFASFTAGDDRFLGFGGGSNWRFERDNAAGIFFETKDSSNAKTGHVLIASPVIDTDYTIYIEHLADDTLRGYVNDINTPVFATSSVDIKSSGWGTSFYIGGSSTGADCGNLVIPQISLAPGRILTAEKKASLFAYIAAAATS